MSQPIALTSAELRGALERASKLVRHVSVRQGWFEFGWHWLGGVAVLFTLDLLFALPVPLRWIGLVGLVLYPAVVAFRVRNLSAESDYPEERSARLVEQGHPEIHSALINAVQFGRVLENATETEAALMRQEIARAEKVVGATMVEESVERDGERRARKFLTWAAVAWVALCILLPGPTFTILPRIFAPWMDNVTPPFSMTKIDLEPKGGAVRYGGSLVLQVAVHGPIPESLSLAVQSPNGTTSNLAMEGTEPGSYAVTLNDLKQDSWIVASGGGARSGRYLVHVLLPPIVQDLRAEYTYAKYTLRKPESETVGDKGIHGWHDTKVHVDVSANRDLTGGEMVIESPDSPAQRISLPVNPKNPRMVGGDFAITASGTFHISLESTDRQENSDAAKGKIVLELDTRPSVWFDEPAQSVVVTPDMKVALAVGADDDAGVTQVDLHRVINGIADDQKSLYRGVPIKRAGARLTLDMTDLGVRPGDEIKYFADAFDNHPNQPNYAETDPYTITVVSPDAFKKMLKDQRDNEQLSREASDIRNSIDSLADQQRELADKMEKLANELKSKPGDPELTKQMAAAQKEQKALQSQTEQLAKKLQDYAKSPSASPIEKALKEKVAEAAEALAKAAEAMKPPSGASPSEAAHAASKAADSLQKTAGQTQKTVGAAIKNIEKIAPLYQDVERFMELLDRQGQLVLESRQFEQKASHDEVDRSKMGTISVEEGHIKDELRALQDDFRHHAADAQADFPKAAASAVKIADEIGRRKIPETMGTSQTEFSQEQGPDGFANAKRALEDMEAMVGQCRGMQGECKGGLDISLSRSLSKPGLGQSLGDCLNPGNGQGKGQGQGQGMGAGAGGTMSGSSGNPANGVSSGPVAYTMSLRSLSTGGGSDSHYHRRAPGEPAALSSDRVEKLGDVERQPPKAHDSTTRGYPAEYRKLIRDYFVSVTKEQKP